MFRFSASRMFSYFLIFGILAILFVQPSIFSIKTEPSAHFFFEHASPELLSRRYNRFSQKDVHAVKRSLTSLSRVLIDEYVTWHRSVVSQVQSGQLDGSSVRTLIYIGNDGGHGLGDRLRGLLLAYFSAVMTDRLLLIYWQNPFPLSNVLVDSFRSNFTYDETYFPSREKENGSPDVKKVRRATLQDLHFYFGVKGNHTKIMFACEPPPRLEDLFKAVEKFPGLPTSVKLKKILPLEVPVQDEQFFPLIFKALFRPSPELRRMMEDITDNRYRLIPSRIWRRGSLTGIDISDPYISVHSRLGFGLGEFIRRFERQMEGQTMESVAYCMAQKAMKLAEQEGITDPPRFYLACDTLEFRKMLRKAILNINSRSQVKYGTWSIKHVRDMVQRTRIDLKLFMYTFIDLYLLSKGLAILRSDSGFSNLAIWMGALPTQMNFDVETDCSFDTTPSH